MTWWFFSEGRPDFKRSDKKLEWAVLWLKIASFRPLRTVVFNGTVFLPFEDHSFSGRKRAIQVPLKFFIMTHPGCVDVPSIFPSNICCTATDFLNRSDFYSYESVIHRLSKYKEGLRSDAVGPTSRTDRIRNIFNQLSSTIDCNKERTEGKKKHALKITILLISSACFSCMFISCPHNLNL